MYSYFRFCFRHVQIYSGIIQEHTHVYSESSASLAYSKPWHIPITFLFLKFGTKMRVCSFLGWDLKIILSYLKSVPWNLPNCKISWKNKNALFGYFWAGIWKRKYCDIWNQRPWICLVARFSAKIKILKFGTKNAWFGYFWTGIWKQHCHIWNQHPWICLITKFRKKMKIPKFGTKNTFY